MKKKIQRSFKYIYLYGYGHFSCPLLFSAQYFRLARLRPEQALQGSVLWDYEYAQEWYALPDRRWRSYAAPVCENPRSNIEETKDTGDR